MIECIKANDLEKDSSIRNFKIDSIYIWPLKKFGVFDDLIFHKSKNASTRAIGSSSFLKKLKSILNISMLKSWWWCRRKEKCNILGFTTANFWRDIGESKINIIFGPILKTFDMKLVIWPWGNSGQKKMPDENKSYRGDWMINKDQGLRVLLSRFNGKYKHNIHVGAWEKKIDSIAPHTFPTVDLLLLFFLYKKTMCKFLKRKKPNYLLIQNCYSTIHQALAVAGKELGIPTIEIQHGIIHKYHPGYIFPHVDYSSNQVDVPKAQYLFVWGQNEKDIILANSKMYREEDIFVIGNPFLEELSSSLQRRCSELRGQFFHQHGIQDKGQKIIFITSQYQTREDFKNFILPVIEKLPKDYIVLLKPHPNEKDVDNFYEELISKDNFFLIPQSFSTLEFFAIADIHSSVFSTCILESFAFGLPNILVELDESETLDSFRSRDDIIRFVKTCDEYLDSLKYFERNKKNEEILHFSSYFLKKNWKENLKQALSNIEQIHKQ